MQAQFTSRTTCINCRGTDLEILSTGLYDEGVIANVIATDPWGENPAPYLKGCRWTYVKCKSCGQTYHRDVLSPEWVEIKYDRWITHEAIQKCLEGQLTPPGRFRSGVAWIEHAIRLEKLSRESRRKDAITLLDFGCGYGDFLTVCASLGFECYGVDRSAHKRSNAAFPIFSDLNSLASELGQKKLDIITLFVVLEHLDDPRTLLEQLAAMHKIGGILVIETPDCDGVTDITVEDSWKIAPIEHINGFTRETLKSLAGRLGYVPLKRPEVHVTSSPGRVLKTELRRLLPFLTKRSTQLYFQKTAK